MDLSSYIQDICKCRWLFSCFGYLCFCSTHILCPTDIIDILKILAFVPVRSLLCIGEWLFCRIHYRTNLIAIRYALISSWTLVFQGGTNTPVKLNVIYWLSSLFFFVTVCTAGFNIICSVMCSVCLRGSKERSQHLYFSEWVLRHATCLQYKTVQLTTCSPQECASNLEKQTTYSQFREHYGSIHRQMHNHPATRYATCLYDTLR